MSAIINNDVLSNLPSKAAQIRYLSECGLTTSQIVKAFAERLGVTIRYQHVNNESIRLGLKKITKKEDSTALKVRIALLEQELITKKVSDSEEFERQEKNLIDAELFMKNEEYVG